MADGDTPGDEVLESEIVSEATEKIAVYRGERAELQQVYEWGRLMAASGYFRDTKSAAQAAVKIMAGREVGFTVVQSMTGIHIIEGKPAMSANLLAASVRRSEKYDYMVKTHTEQECEIDFLRLEGNDWVTIGTSNFNMRDAELAGLAGGQNYQKYPRNMLFARAMTNGIGWYCPDVFQTKMYTPEELRPDIELDASGDVMDVSQFAVPEGEGGAHFEPEAKSPPQTPQEPRQQPRQAQPANGGRSTRSSLKQPPETLENLGHLLSFAQFHFGWQPNQVAEFLQVENVGGIAAAVTELYEGDFDYAGNEIREHVKGENAEEGPTDADDVGSEDEEPDAGKADS
jgi:hypothetical protein